MVVVSKPIRIAFGHKARAGKDTAVDHIKSTNGCNVIRFAEPVYAIGDQVQDACDTLYAMPLIETISRIYTAINDIVELDLKYPEAELKMEKWIGRTLIPRILVEDTTGRKGEKVTWLLQMIGADFRNIVDQNIWVNIASDNIAAVLSRDPNANICCPDVRFPNEYEMLENAGFALVKINRKNRPIDRDPNHLSETALDKHPFHIVIDNDSTLDAYIATLDLTLEYLYGKK